MKKWSYILLIITLIITSIFSLSCSLKKDKKDSQLEQESNLMQNIKGTQPEQTDEQANIEKEIGENVISPEKITKKEALNYLFDYLYGDSEDIQEVIFYDNENYWGNKLWGYVVFFKERTSPTVILDAGMSSDGLYQEFCLEYHIYNDNGEWEYFINTLNVFAINRKTGEIIQQRLNNDETGLWEPNPEYFEIK